MLLLFHRAEQVVYSNEGNLQNVISGSSKNSSQKVVESYSASNSEIDTVSRAISLNADALKIICRVRALFEHEVSIHLFVIRLYLHFVCRQKLKMN